MDSCDREKYLLLKFIDKDLVDVLKGNKCIIAGGAVTSVFSGSRINDYDIFFREKEAIKVVRDYLDGEDSKYEWVISTDTAITYKPKKEHRKLGLRTIQLIILPETIGLGPADLIRDFDFTICMGAYSFYPESFTLCQDFLKHIAQKRLIFNTNSKYPLSSLFRTRKFMNRGYRISGSETIKLGLSINNLNIKTFGELRRHLLGIDTLFLKPLTDRLLDEDMAEKEYDFGDFLHFIDDFINKHYNSLSDHDEFSDYNDDI